MTTIVFQGDSITDAGRDHTRLEPNDPKGLGSGYANLIAARLLYEHPQKNLRFLNRGVSGNRIVDLRDRWQADALDLRPDVLSILIGVNDTWHGFSGGRGVPVDAYEVVYRQLLAETRRQRPDALLLLCEPFVLPVGVVTPAWLPEMEARREVVRGLAGEFGGIFVPFQAALDEAAGRAPAATWLSDGVHPTAAGHQLLADSWLAHLAL